MMAIYDKIARAAYRVRFSIYGPSLFTKLPPTSVSEANRATLTAEIGALEENRTTGRTNAISDTTTVWNKSRRELRKSLRSKDILRFLTWPEVRSTMFYDAPLEEWRSVRKCPIWKSDLGTLSESQVGMPLPYIAYPATSGNLVHHAYHISNLLAQWKISFASLESIVEIGGGYGSMCRLLYHLGFSGRYTIFDLAEFTALQRYFLTMIGLLPTKDIRLISNIESLGEARDADLAIMTWSLSEMPTNLRDKIVSSIGRPQIFLIAYQGRFEGTDNRGYFSRLKDRLPGYEWREYEIPHLGGNYYLIGKQVSTTR